MHLELVELLRCPVNHAVGVLVASADEIENRYVMQGILGCPECFAEYVVRDGVTHFVEPGLPNAVVRGDGDSEVDRDSAMRLAAQLGLSAGRTVFALIGFGAEMVLAMREIVAARVLLFNAPGAPTTEMLIAASQVAPSGVARCGDVLPLTARKFDGIAFAPSTHTASLLDQAVIALRPGARLVASVTAAVPAGMRELVRDDRVWVAEREAAASAPIALVRR